MTPESIRDAYARAGLLSWAALVPCCQPQAPPSSRQHMPPSPFATSPYTPSGVPLPSFSGRQPPLRISTSKRKLQPEASMTQGSQFSGPHTQSTTSPGISNGQPSQGLAVGALHHYGLVAELQMPQAAQAAPAKDNNIGSMQPDYSQPAPESIDQNPFSASFGRSSGVDASDLIQPSDAAAFGSISVAAAEAEAAVDQNPFAAFVQPRASSGFVPPQIQLPEENDQRLHTGPSSGQQHGLKESQPNVESASELGGAPGAAVVLDCSLRGIEVRVPWDQDPGAAIRFTELWAKAFQQVLP